MFKRERRTIRERKKIVILNKNTIFFTGLLHRITKVLRRDNQLRPDVFGFCAQ